MHALGFTTAQKTLWKIRTGPLGPRAVASRGPSGCGEPWAVGPWRAVGRWAAGPWWTSRPLGRDGPWAASLLLAKPGGDDKLRRLY